MRAKPGRVLADGTDAVEELEQIRRYFGLDRPHGSLWWLCTSATASVPRTSSTLSTTMSRPA
jgi:hypothetical protein